MTLLSRKTDYALLILAFLHQHREGGCAREIAERFGLSRAFVANILKELCQKGFVVSHRGVKGGYVLQRPLEEVNLAEILEALDERFRLASCTGHSGTVVGDDGCWISPICPIKGPIAEVHARIIEVFRTVSLADLLQPHLPMATVQSVLATLPLREPCTAETT